MTTTLAMPASKAVPLSDSDNSGITLGNRQEQGEAFWDRMQLLMGSEDPYAFAARVGLNKSTFQSARERRSKPRATTLTDWAQRLGCNPDWLIRGAGDMWLPQVTHQVQGMVNGYQFQSMSQQGAPAIQAELLEMAIITLEDALKTTRRQMSLSNKARLIASIYALYAGVPDPSLVRDTVTELIRSAA